MSTACKATPCTVSSDGVGDAVAPNVEANVPHGTYQILCSGGHRITMSEHLVEQVSERCSFFRGAWKSSFKESDSRTLNLDAHQCSVVRIVLMLAMGHNVSFDELLNLGSDVNCEYPHSIVDEVAHLGDFLQVLPFFPHPLDFSRNLFTESNRNEFKRCFFSYHQLQDIGIKSQIKMNFSTFDGMSKKQHFDLLQSQGIVVLPDGNGMGPHIELETNQHQRTGPHLSYMMLSTLSLGAFFSHFARLLVEARGQRWHTRRPPQLRLTLPVSLGTIEFTRQRNINQARRISHIRCEDSEIITWTGAAENFSDAIGILSAVSNRMLLCCAGERSTCKIEMCDPEQFPMEALVEAVSTAEDAILQWNATARDFWVEASQSDILHILRGMNDFAKSGALRSDHARTLNVQEITPEVELLVID
jgi:hypothetical protein